MRTALLISSRKAACLLALSLMLSACGGGDDGGGGSVAPPSQGGGSATTGTPMQVLVPAYFNPSPGWDQLTSGAKAYPDVSITAVLNPENGNFTQENPLFTAAINAFKAQGGQVIGYVLTDYGDRSASDVKANIDNYLKHYPKVDGFFLDEMEAFGAKLAYYRDIAAYIRSKNSRLKVFGNPGAYAVASYGDLADTLVTFEGKAAAYQQATPEPNYTWVYSKPTTAQAMMAHNAATCTQMQTAVSTAHSPRLHTGQVYVTNLEYDSATGVGNPWKTLPSYWMQLLGTVDAINKGQALPAC